MTVMQQDWAQTVAPLVEPVSLAEIKAQIRIDHDDEDELLDRLRLAARRHVEQLCGRGIYTQTWVTILSEWWDDVVWLPMAAPLQSVSSVKYYDTTGTLQTLSAGNYVVEARTQPGSIGWAANATIPTVQSDRRYPVEITYVVGWSDVLTVPQTIQQAIHLLIAHWWENRSGIVVSVGGTALELPMGIRDLVAGDLVVWKPTTCRV